jgi:DNA-directed RNA polymerase specialized sigma24 family protein
MTRERPMVSDGAEAGPDEPCFEDGSPSQFAQAEEVYERLLCGVDETQRTIIQLRHHGYSNAEIAERTGWNIRKVQRFLKDLEDSMGESGG